MKVKNHKKQKLIQVDDLNAYKAAYSKPLESKDYIKYMMYPGLITGGLITILLYTWWVTIIFFIAGAIYGLKELMPKSIKRSYEIAALRQRNNFTNNMTQILTDSVMTVPRALALVESRAVGEFRDDITKLHARLMKTDNDGIAKAFKIITTKYQKDVIFTQFVEQIETAMIEGRVNVDTLKDIKSYHNDMFAKQNEYIEKKNGHLRDIKMLGFVVIIFILSISFSFGFSTYINAFAHHAIGWVTCFIYSFLMLNFFRKFSTYLFDDSIMEVKL